MKAAPAGTRRYAIRVHSNGQDWTASRVGQSAEDAINTLRREYPGCKIMRILPMFQKGGRK